MSTAPTESGLPPGPIGDWARVWRVIGASGFVSVLAATIVLGIMGMFWQSLKNGQETQQHQMDRLFQRLDTETKDSATREEKLIERADRLNKENFERWEKARERSEDVRIEVKAISAKVDTLLKLRDEKGK